MREQESRIQSAIDHINTALDVDPWAKKLAEKALRYMLVMSGQHNCNDCGFKNCRIRPEWGQPARVNCYQWRAKDNGGCNEKN